MDRVIILTGSSGGIGLELMKLTHEKGVRVMATALPDSVHLITEAGFRESDKLMIRPLDLRDHANIDRVVKETLMCWGRIDVLINNAGISYRGVAEQMSAEEELEQMTVNYLGPMSLTRRVLSVMRLQRRGHIVNVSSVGGMMAMPTMSSYSASKWALEGASEALWYEMRPFGVFVTLIEPGFINSAAFQKVRFPKATHDLQPGANPYEEYYTNMGRFVTWLMEHSLATSASVAAVIMRQVLKKHPPLRVQATLDAWIFNALRRFLPRRLYHPLLYRFLPGIRSWGKPRS
ncbi:MAG: SDR family oxidoreductase [bacterium]|nr:SDR family oxidoreductase [bacterium]